MNSKKNTKQIKLINALNKFTKTGVVKSGTVGPEGRPTEVSHVHELLKDVPDEELHSDSN